MPRDEAALADFSEFLREGGNVDTPDTADPVTEFFWRAEYDCGGTSPLAEIYKRRAEEARETADTRNAALGKSAKTEAAAAPASTLDNFQKALSQAAGEIRKKIERGEWIGYVEKIGREHPDEIESLRRELREEVTA